MAKQPPKQPPPGRRRDLYFATKLDRAMTLRRKAVTELAGAIGVIQPRVSKWLAGTGEPPPRVLMALSRALGIPLEYWCNPDLDDPADAVAWGGPAAGSGGGEPIVLPEAEAAVKAAIKRLGAEEVLRRIHEAPPPQVGERGEYARVIRTRVHRTAREEQDEAGGVPGPPKPRDRRRKPGR